MKKVILSLLVVGSLLATSCGDPKKDAEKKVEEAQEAALDNEATDAANAGEDVKDATAEGTEEVKDTTAEGAKEVVEGAKEVVEGAKEVVKEGAKEVVKETKEAGKAGVDAGAKALKGAIK